MLVKGSQEYKEAGKLANELTRISQLSKWNDNSSFDMYYEILAKGLSNILKLDIFASKIATTILDNMNPYSNKIAYISSKQAWILSCAMIENKIEIN